MRAPRVPEAPVPVLSDDQLRALLRWVEGRDFISGRDAAILRLLVDTGVGHRDRDAGGRRWPLYPRHRGAASPLLDADRPGSACI